MKKYFPIFIFLIPLIYSIVCFKNSPLLYSFIIIIFLALIIKTLINGLKYSKIWINLTISLIFLYLIFFRVQFKEFIVNFKKIDLKYLILIFLSIIFSLYFRGYKLKYLLSHIKKIKISTLFKSTTIGFMINSILPARIGELVRAYIISKDEKISKVTSLTCIILERIFDGIVVASFLVYILLAIPQKNVSLNKIGIISSVIYLILIFALILIYQKFNFIIKITHKIIFLKKFQNRIISLLNSFYNGLHIFKNFKELLIFVIYTYILWLIAVLQTYYFFKCMDMLKFFYNTPYNNFFISMFFTFIMTLGYAIPSGPGALGPLQTSIILGFKILIPDAVSDLKIYTQIVSFSMFVWLVQEIFQSIPAIFVILIEGINLKEIKFSK